MNRKGHTVKYARNYSSLDGSLLFFQGFTMFLVVIVIDLLLLFNLLSLIKFSNVFLYFFVNILNEILHFFLLLLLNFFK